MSNQIDNLFKKKLETHSVEPSSSAWAKVSSNTSKKNKGVIWFRAAAAFLLMVSALWLYNNSDDNTTSKITEVAYEELKTEEPVVIQKEVNDANSLEENNTTHTSIPPVQKTKLPSLAQNDKPKNKTLEPLRIELAKEPLEVIAQIDLIPLENATAVKETVTSTKPIVIVYELKSYTKKTEPESELEPILQKKNSLKKVLDVANNIRTGESPLGGLRQAKEDLFALNFKKEEKNNR